MMKEQIEIAGSIFDDLSEDVKTALLEDDSVSERDAILWAVSLALANIVSRTDEEDDVGEEEATTAEEDLMHTYHQTCEETMD